MNSVDFVTAYSRGDQLVAAGPEQVGPATWYNHYLGQVLHNHLSGNRREEVNDQFLVDYHAWLESDPVPHFDHVMNLRMPLAGLTNNDRFHLMNYCMLGQWTDNLQTEERNQIINSQQDILAVVGLGLYCQREAIFRANPNGERQDLKEVRAKVEGWLNEYDAAIVLLEVERRNPLIEHVVPAPAQFEADLDRGRNADFIVLTGDQAVGVQVKSHVRDKDIKANDPSRIVLVDADYDMGNVISKKVAGRSKPIVTGWGGIICAQRIVKMNPHHNEVLEETSKVSPSYHKRMLRTLFVAKQIVAGIKPNFNQAVSRIEGRLMPKLTESSVPLQRDDVMLLDKPVVDSQQA